LEARIERATIRAHRLSAEAWVVKLEEKPEALFSLEKEIREQFVAGGVVVTDNKLPEPFEARINAAAQLGQRMSIALRG